MTREQAQERMYEITRRGSEIEALKKKLDHEWNALREEGFKLMDKYSTLKFRRGA